MDGEKGWQATYTWLDVCTLTQWKQEKTRQNKNKAKKQKKTRNIKVIIIYKTISLAKSCYAEHTHVWVCVYLWLIVKRPKRDGRPPWSPEVGTSGGTRAVTETICNPSRLLGGCWHVADTYSPFLNLPSGVSQLIEWNLNRHQKVEVTSLGENELFKMNM